MDHYARQVLKGYDFKGVRSTGPKAVRAQPFAAACEAGNVKLVRGPWNREFLDELCCFPLGEHDDMVDAASGAFEDLRGRSVWEEYNAIENPATFNDQW